MKLSVGGGAWPEEELVRFLRRSGFFLSWILDHLFQDSSEKFPCKLIAHHD